MKLVKGFIFLSLFFFVSSTSVFATDVVINEFLVEPDSDQWVELYNKGQSSINISGWVIDDSGGTQKFTIPQNTVINALEFKVFQSSYFNLNRTSSDVIRLLNGDYLEDSYSYPNSPGIGYSYGRNIDGEGIWVVFNNPTKESSNNSSTPLPTSTLTPTPSFSPTPTTKPTPTPKPSPTGKPTSTFTSKAVLTTTSNSVSKTPSSTKAQTRIAESQALGENVKNATFTSNINLSSPSSKKEKKVLASNENSLPKILFSIGALFIISCGILTFKNYRDKQINQ